MPWSPRGGASSGSPGIWAAASGLCARPSRWRSRRTPTRRPPVLVGGAAVPALLPGTVGGGAHQRRGAPSRAGRARLRGEPADAPAGAGLVVAPRWPRPAAPCGGGDAHRAQPTGPALAMPAAARRPRPAATGYAGAPPRARPRPRDGLRPDPAVAGRHLHRGCAGARHVARRRARLRLGALRVAGERDRRRPRRSGSGARDAVVPGARGESGVPRQTDGYGRATLDLRKARVLAAP